MCSNSDPKATLAALDRIGETLAQPAPARQAQPTPQQQHDRLAEDFRDALNKNLTPWFTFEGGKHAA